MSIKGGIGLDKIASLFLGSILGSWNVSRRLTETLGILDTLGIKLKLGLALGTGMLEFLEIIGEEDVEEDKSIGKGQETGVVNATVMIASYWEWTKDLDNYLVKEKLLSWNTLPTTITLPMDLFRHKYPFWFEAFLRKTHPIDWLSNLHDYNSSYMGSTSNQTFLNHHM